MSARARQPADVAEPIPGPSTEYFGELAKKHNLYIVAGLVRARRASGLQHGRAARAGRQAGRQVSQGVPAARRDRRRALRRGTEYPVFETRFGKVGMMVCYDGFFPEVARELDEPRRGGDRLAGVGLQPAAGAGAGVREPRLPGEQHLRGRLAQLDVLGGVRPKRRDDRAGEGMGDGGGGGGGPRTGGRSGSAWAISRPKYRGIAPFGRRGKSEPNISLTPRFIACCALEHLSTISMVSSSCLCPKLPPRKVSPDF